MDLVRTFVPLLGSLVILFVLARLIVSTADDERQAQETDGGLEFTPNRRSFWGVYVFVAFMGYVAVSSLFNGLKSALDFLPAGLSVCFILLLLAAFPGSIRSDQKGLEQAYWLRGRRRIAWSDVVRVTVNDKKIEIKISGKGGTKILHSRQLPDRARLIDELKRHCNEKLPAELAQKSVSL
ncbi:MAG TPA: hypothetical protein VL967_15480 [Terracidiphilus sp.]|nr:hypothetical protein [Terracidiphilus sp.]